MKLLLIIHQDYGEPDNFYSFEAGSIDEARDKLEDNLIHNRSKMTEVYSEINKITESYPKYNFQNYSDESHRQHYAQLWIDRKKIEAEAGIKDFYGHMIGAYSANNDCEIVELDQFYLDHLPTKHGL